MPRGNPISHVAFFSSTISECSCLLPSVIGLLLGVLVLFSVCYRLVLGVLSTCSRCVLVLFSTCSRLVLVLFSVCSRLVLFLIFHVPTLCSRLVTGCSRLVLVLLLSVLVLLLSIPIIPKMEYSSDTPIQWNIPVTPPI